MITEQVIKKLITETIKGIDISRLGIEDNFVEFGLDSLDLASILMAIDERLGVNIPDKDVDQCSSIQGIVDYCRNKEVAL
ncbi:acyl carrier protein [Legionella impletisoli]|uniref:Carrier domain-containing protein n=1 Tax=Legionella impletisoli TaxID=343510 RepID=A0A917JP94_9GAMM|nr:acyl carrier protein [Legionella impletisoli]GGI80014.1 hypothetical protein GCM10007966_05670 [Legionella impletisoli]